VKRTIVLMARKIAQPLQETQERLEDLPAIEAAISRVLSHFRQ
jgi:hypothetical protein